MKKITLRVDEIALAAFDDLAVKAGPEDEGLTMTSLRSSLFERMINDWSALIQEVSRTSASVSDLQERLKHAHGELEKTSGNADELETLRCNIARSNERHEALEEKYESLSFKNHRVEKFNEALMASMLFLLQDREL